MSFLDSIKEEEEENEPKEKQFKPPTPTDTSPVKPYAWRIDLAQTETHWTGWFTNLSSKFLSVPATKMLILAGIGMLERDLTAGQMQGKFYPKPVTRYMKMFRTEWQKFWQHF